jgi:transcriptional regulator with XRE-family HTH domain
MPIDLSVTPADFAARIKAERLRLGYSQQRAADLLGLSARQSYADLENPDGSNPGAIRLTELAAIGYDVRRILVEAHAMRGRVRPAKTTDAP